MISEDAEITARSRSKGGRERPQRLWVAGLALAAGIWLGLITALDGYGQVDRAQPADAIVVMGARTYPGGALGPTLRRRADHAAALYARGLAPVVICSGGLGPFPPTEAEAACARVQTLGVPAEAILLEDQAHSTEENALFTALLLRERGWDSVIIATDGYHAYRAGLMFRRQGIEAYPSPAQLTTYSMSLGERFFRENRELAALAAYWLKTALGLPITNFQ